MRLWRLVVVIVVAAIVLAGGLGQIWLSFAPLGAVRDATGSAPDHGAPAAGGAGAERLRLPHLAALRPGLSGRSASAWRGISPPSGRSWCAWWWSSSRWPWRICATCARISIARGLPCTGIWPSSRRSSRGWGSSGKPPPSGAGPAEPPAGSKPSCPEQEELYLRRALALAARSLGRTAPKPARRRGGAGGPGRRRGLAPRRRAAPRRGRGPARGGRPRPRGHDLRHPRALLAPWPHPPCTDALIAAGVARAVYPCADTDPRCAGAAAEILGRGGIQTVCGPLAAGLPPE